MCAQVDEIPVVDAVVTHQIEIVELTPPHLAGFAGCRFLRHDRDGPSPRLVNVAFEELLDLCDRHVDMRLGEVEDGAHAHADEAIARAIVAGAGLEVAPYLFQFLVGLVRPECRDEGCGRRRSGNH
jgi:hypothetical protein